MENVKQFIEDTLRRRAESYASSPNYIISDYINEKRISDSYSGREIFELLQNADDASKNAKDKIVQFRLEKGRFYASNNGAAFSIEGYRSILFAGLSGKPKEVDSIGEKGYGFRSLLNWSDEICINSGGVEVNFSQRNSLNFVRQVLKNYPESQEIYTKSCVDCNRDPDSVAKLVAPEISANAREIKFDTEISLSINDEIFKDINEKLKAISPQTLLFLNNLTSIEIITPDIEITYSKTVISNAVTVSISNRGNVTQMCWNVISRTFEIEGKPQSVAVAWNDSFRDEDGHLYSFFRTEEGLPLPLIAHGTFDLTLDRNYLLPNSKKNVEIMRHLIAVMVDAALELAKNNFDYSPLSLVTCTNGQIGAKLSELNFKEELKAEVKKHCLFPTVNNTMITLTSDTYYISEQEVANLLSGDDVMSLLKPCNDDGIVKEYIEANVSRYSVQQVSKIIEKRSHSLDNFGIDNYAVLLKYLLDNYNISPVETLPMMLFDGKRNLIPWNYAIMIKTSRYDIEYPHNIPVAFVHRTLLQELKRLYDVETTQNLEQKLRCLNVKCFSPIEMMEAIVQHYKTKQKSKSSVIELHKFLYPIFYEYAAELCKTHIANAPKVIAKDGSVVDIEKCYFGKAYGKDITEMLYSFDESKLLADQKQYKLGKEVPRNCYDYFKWLGIADYPRWFQHSERGANMPYANYLFEKWHYEKQFEGLDVSSYEVFQTLYHNETCISVQTIDSIDEILANSSTETIIAWIAEDKNLFTCLKEDTEPAKSFVSVSTYGRRDRTTRWKSDKILNSYIRWKFMTTSWLTAAKTNKRVAPEICTTSQIITDDFKPFIEKPGVKEDSQIFKNHGVNKQTIQSILSLVGVNASIADFRTGVIYSLLLNLPTLSQDGQKAKSVYNALIDSTEKTDINVHDADFVKFRKYGKVFCKDGKYHTLGETYYFPTKRFGSSILKHFSAIAIDARKNSKNIEKVFGIKPFKADSITIQANQVAHVLQDKFEKDIDEFKPFVYLYRRKEDNRGYERARLIEVKFRLLPELCYSINKGGEIYELRLDDYGSLYDEVSNTMYVVAPKDVYDYSDLKTRVPFKTAVAESFAAIFNIEMDSEIRELFGSADSARKDIIRDRFDDDNLSKLEQSERELGRVHNYQVQFWDAIVRCVANTELLENNECTGEELLAKVIELMPEYAVEIREMFGCLGNYQDYSRDLPAAEKLVSFLRKSKVALSSFNEYVYPTFDISFIYLKEFSKMREMSKKLFVSALYRKFANTPREQSQFIGKIAKYDALVHPIPQDIIFDCKYELFTDVKSLFGIDLNQEIETVEIDGSFLNNKSILVETFSERLKTEQIEQFINENTENRSLLYFEEGRKLLESKLRLKIEKQNNGDINFAPTIQFGGKEQTYNSLKELFKMVDSMDIEQSALNIEKDVSIPHVPHGQRIRSPKVFVERSLKDEDKYGALGEALVYKFLRDKYPSNEYDVQWVSGNAEKAGINTFVDDSAGYDICLKHRGEIMRLIEVKTQLSDNNVFHISTNEVKVGMGNKEIYDVYVVKNIQTDHPSIGSIEGIFKLGKGQTFFNNEKFRVENDKYLISYKEIK